MTADVRPGTVPSWAIRYARKELADGGEEWLVLTDTEPETHTCEPTSERGRYLVATCSGFGLCGKGGCVAMMGERPTRRRWYGDDRAEAEAAFLRLEAAWLAE